MGNFEGETEEYQPVCQKCGAPVGIGKDGRPFRNCFKCNQAAARSKAPVARPSNPAMPPPMGKDPKEDYWQGKAKDDLIKNAQDIRSRSVAHAISYMAATATSRVSAQSIEDVLKTAEKIETHIKAAKPEAKP